MLVRAEGASLPIDTTKAELELEMHWQTWEEVVRSVTDQQLGFLNFSKAALKSSLAAGKNLIFAL